MELNLVQEGSRGRVKSHSNGLNSSQNSNNNNPNNPAQRAETPIGVTKDEIKTTPKRYIILFLFASSSLINAFQWIYLSSMTNLLSNYYNVSNVAINWTSMVYMMSYIPLILPSIWLFERIGLRKAVILGSVGTSIGALIKCLSCKPDRFVWLMFGQTIAAISQLFILSVPPRLASVWFPDHQVALANAVGVFGNQFGIALGFIIPQAIVNIGTTITSQAIDVGTIETGLQRLFIAVALISSIISIVIIILFDDSPRYAPGLARFRQMMQENVQPLIGNANCDNTHKGHPFFRLILDYARDRNFILLMISYGINVGVFYAISTILNQMFTTTTTNVSINVVQDSAAMVAKLGLMMVISGMVGSLVSGYILDKTHMYRFVNASMYLLTLLSTLLLGYVIHEEFTLGLTITIVSLGFFMAGYLVIGYEISNEITWPKPESVSAGLLNLSAQLFGLFLTYSGSIIVDLYGPLWVNLFYSINLLMGLVITCMIRMDLRRNIAMQVDD